MVLIHRSEMTSHRISDLEPHSSEQCCAGPHEGASEDRRAREREVHGRSFQRPCDASRSEGLRGVDEGVGYADDGVPGGTPGFIGSTNPATGWAGPSTGHSQLISG